MRMRVSWMWLSGVVMAGIAAGHLSATGAARPAVQQVTSPASVALKGATVVVGDGRVLQNATVVLRGQLIEAVGVKVTVPAGAVEIDLKGAFLYPGLIDALTDRFQKPAAGPAEAEPADTESAAMFAHVCAADLLDPASNDPASWRDAGVLAANVAPGRGIFMGQTAVVTLGDGANRVVVKPSATMRVALQGLGYRNRRRGQGEFGGVYPQRLIGVLSYVRQTLLDAHYYGEALRFRAANPSVAESLPVSRSLEALVPVARRTMPLLFPAGYAREVQRVVDIADDTDVACAVVGGYEAAQVASALTARKIPVIVGLDYPTIDADVHPDFRVQIDVLRYNEHAPRAAAELARAGVRIAFASVGLKTGSEFLANLRLAVREGLSKDAAVRAATLTAAEILGVDRQLGSLEAGKIANVIVADGDLFDSQTRIRTVYVGGSRHEVTAAPVRQASVATTVQAPPAPEPKIPATPSEVLIKNATVMTATRGTITGGSVLVRDGKIVAVGRGLAAGPRALVVDGTGRWVTPGLIDCHVHSPTDSHNEATANVTAQTDLKDLLYPQQVVLYWTLASGVTTSNVFHGSVNPIGGKTAVIKSRWGKDAKGLLFEGARPGLKMSVEEFVGRASTPSSYPGVEIVVREAFGQAREYQQRWDAYEKRRTTAGTPLLPPRRDLAMEALVEVLTGDRWVHAHILNARNDDPRAILSLLRLADEIGFHVATVQHAATAYRVADELAAHGTGASLFGFFIIETPYAAFVLTRRGVTTSLNSDGPRQGRDLNQQAGMLMKTGLTEDEALALVTINPAKQLGIDARVGSIEVGKDADLVVWNHYTLGFLAIADQVFIDGQLYFSRDYDRTRQAWIESERRRLAASGGKITSLRPLAGAEATGSRGMEVDHVR